MIWLILTYHVSDSCCWCGKKLRSKSYAGFTLCEWLPIFDLHMPERLAPPLVQGLEVGWRRDNLELNHVPEYSCFGIEQAAMQEDKCPPTLRTVIITLGPIIRMNGWGVWHWFPKVLNQRFKGLIKRFPDQIRLWFNMNLPLCWAGDPPTWIISRKVTEQWLHECTHMNMSAITIICSRIRIQIDRDRLFKQPESSRD